ncbi:WD40/YVTN/BNR-like repeat-containing protein [Nocardia sp. NPDC060249]|uniref:WD40/YVTN/BNR-like repeat-containing protein n=1 Tax=Nocardia sp. NPDC060249 TaxID=3347082 RepID=UPI00365BD924
MRQWGNLIRSAVVAILPLSVMRCGVLSDPHPAFQPTAVTFVSADEGWILGHRESCGKASCGELFHTTDGGHSWRKSAPPPFGVTRLVFADSRNGWAYYSGTSVGRERELYSTHDGGGSWDRVSVPVGVASTEWTDPVISDGTVQIALFDPRISEARMLSSPVGVDTFTASQPFRIDVAASTHRSVYVELGLTRAGSSSWFVVTVSSPDNSQSPAGGARFVDGNWSPWTLPCVNPNPPRLAAVSPTDLFVS